MSLAKAVQTSIDRVFKHSKLGDYVPVKVKGGSALRRYYRRSEFAEYEVTVYQDKWWTKAGGRIFGDLYCLHEDVQQALGDCTQNWLEPDYAKPLHYFQYSLCQASTLLELEVRSHNDVKALSTRLKQFLIEQGLAWFQQFDTHEGITAHLEHEMRYLALAQWQAYLGHKETALAAFKQYMAGLPRTIDNNLQSMRACDVLTEEDCQTLLAASLQEQNEYERRVKHWQATAD